MIVVLDASAAIEIVLNRPNTYLFKPVVKEAETIIAPDLFIPETTNVFWKYHEFEDLSMVLAGQFLESALLLIDDFVSSKDLYIEAFSLACQEKHSVYDMLYLVLARRNNAVLLTNDKRLKKVAIKYAIKIEPV